MLFSFLFPIFLLYPQLPDDKPAQCLHKRIHHRESRIENRASSIVYLPKCLEQLLLRDFRAKILLFFDICKSVCIIYIDFRFLLHS